MSILDVRRYFEAARLAGDRDKLRSLADQIQVWKEMDERARTDSFLLLFEARCYEELGDYGAAAVAWAECEIAKPISLARAVEHLREKRGYDISINENGRVVCGPGPPRKLENSPSEYAKKDSDAADGDSQSG